MTVEHGGRVFEASERLGRPLAEILDFSSNTNAFFDLEGVKELLRGNLDWLALYPDLDRSRRALSSFLQIPPSNLWVGNGSGQLIYLVLQALRPREVLIPVPTFSEYERAARATGAKVSFLPLRQQEGFRLEPRALLRALSPETEAVFLCNPNNPTGGLVSEEGLFELHRALERRGIWLLVDEAFVDFVVPQRRPSLERRALEGRLVLLRSLTKALAIPGLRLGYIVGPQGVVERVEGISPPWPISTFAQLILEHLEELWRTFEEGLPELFGQREALKEKLHGLFEVFPSEANFFLVRTGVPSGALASSLLRRGILVREGTGFRGLGEGFIRVAVRRPEENSRLIEALKEVKDGSLEGGDRRD